MPGELETTSGHSVGTLIDLIRKSWEKDVFFLVLALIAGLIGIAGTSVPKEIRFGALGFMLLAFLVLGGLLLRDIWRWWQFDEFQRERAYVHSAEACGVGYESLRIVGHLDEDNGAIGIRREVELKAFSAPVTKIDQYVFVPAGGDGGAEIEGKIIGMPGTTRITITPFERLPTAHHAILTFDPPIPRGETLGFTYEEVLNPGTIALTKKQQGEKREPFQYLAWDIIRPVKDFALILTWGKGVPIANPKYDVWFGKTQVQHDREVARIKKENWFQDSSNAADPNLSLKVRYPVLGGLVYVVRWDPPA